MPKPQIHKSMIGCFDRCPMQYYYRYCEGKKIAPASAMLVGTGVHISSASDLTSKRDSGELLPAEAVLETARDAVNKKWDEEGVLLSAEENLIGEKKIRGQTVDMAVLLAGLHHDKLAPIIHPKNIERPFVIELNGFPVDFAGTLDLQETTGVVRELKTRASSPPEGLADSSLDLTCYGLAAKALDGQNPPSLALDCLVKTKTPKVVSLTSTRSDGAYRAFLMRVEAIGKSIQSGAFPPCSSESWCCSEKWCGYFGICPHGKAAKVLV